MNLVLNLLWAVLGGGFITAVEYLLAGLVCCLTVVGIPFGMQCFKLAGLALFPFGKDFKSRGGVVSLPLNVLWFVFAGLWIFLSHLALAAPLAVSIIGIPFAYQHLKLGMLALTPFGAQIHRA